MSEKPVEQSWGRAQLTLRLPAPRLAQLRALAKQMGGDATPTDAVIRAIAMASAHMERTPNDFRLDAIEDELSAITAAHTLASDRIEAAIVVIGRSIGQLYALIGEAASQIPPDP